MRTYHTSRDTSASIRGLAVWCWCLAVRLACGDQRRFTGSGSVSEACWRRCAIQIHRYFTLLL